MLPSLLCHFPGRRVLSSALVAFVLAVCVAGCKPFDPSQWPQEQVSKEIAEQWDLVSVDLKRSEGGYVGTGKNAEGETFSITVKLDPATKSATYQGKGDRGTELDYSVRAETVR